MVTFFVDGAPMAFSTAVVFLASGTGFLAHGRGEVSGESFASSHSEFLDKVREDDGDSSGGGAE